MNSRHNFKSLISSLLLLVLLCFAGVFADGAGSAARAAEDPYMFIQLKNCPSQTLCNTGPVSINFHDLIIGRDGKCIVHPGKVCYAGLWPDPHYMCYDFYLDDANATNLAKRVAANRCFYSVGLKYSPSTSDVVVDPITGAVTIGGPIDPTGQALIRADGIDVDFPALGVGSHTITARRLWVGDTYVAPAPTYVRTITLDVTAAPTDTDVQLSSGTNPGSASTITANLIDKQNTGKPFTGAITYYVNGSQYCQTGIGGSCAMTFSNGQYFITAAYSGDTAHKPATSAVLVQKSGTFVLTPTVTTAYSGVTPDGSGFGGTVNVSASVAANGYNPNPVMGFVKHRLLTADTGFLNGFEDYTIVPSDPRPLETRGANNTGSTLLDPSGFPARREVNLRYSQPGNYILESTYLPDDSHASSTIVTPIKVGETKAAVVAGDGQSSLVNKAFTLGLKARFTYTFDTTAVPVFSGTRVIVTVPPSGASAIVTPATIDNNGVVTLPLRANGIAGTYVVNVRLADSDASVNFTLTNQPVQSTWVLSSPQGTGQSAKVSNAFATPLQVKLVDNTGAPVPNQTVTFHGPPSGATAILNAVTAVTDAQGLVSVTATANAFVGDYSLTATVDGVATSASFALTNTADPLAPATITMVSGNGQRPKINTPFGAPLKVKVLDAGGNPVVGTPVIFESFAGASAIIDNPRPLTDSQGIATVNATANGSVGYYHLNARVDGIVAPVDFVATNIGTPSSIAIVSGSPQSSIVGQSFALPLKLRVLDANGEPVPDAQITFSGPASGATAFLNTVTPITDAGGIATVSATANPDLGAYALTASVAGVTQTVSFALTNLVDPATVPASIVIYSGNNQRIKINTDFDEPLFVRVLNSSGTPLANIPVTFSTAAGASATFDNATPVTDVNGLASVNATANASIGSYHLTAAVAGVAPVQFTAINLGGAFGIAVVSGNNQSAPRNGAYVTPLGVKVTDSNGEPVSGVTVTFNGPANGPTANLNEITPVTDYGGSATVFATANNQVGGFQLTANVAGVSTPATFALTNTLDVGSFTMVSGNAQRPKVNEAFAQPLRVKVLDGSGNPVVGVPVFFQGGAGASATFDNSTPITDASGIATTNATANASVGFYHLTAYVGANVPPVTFDETNLGPPFGIAVVSGSGQSADLNTAYAAPLVMRVTDSNGQGLGGVTIHFNGPASGPTAIIPAVDITTGADGTASTTATASAFPGPFTLSASVADVATPAVFALTNTSTLPAPTVSAISPPTGDALGGTAVTISGTGFTGATGVTIGGKAASVVTVVNDTTITATTPAGSAPAGGLGPASVFVSTASGISAANSLYSYFNTPVITGVSFAKESLGCVGIQCNDKCTTTLTGRNFTGVTSLLIASPVSGFSAPYGSFVVQDDSTIINTHFGSGNCSIGSRLSGGDAVSSIILFKVSNSQATSNEVQVVIQVTGSFPPLFITQHWRNIQSGYTPSFPFKNADGYAFITSIFGQPATKGYVKLVEANNPDTDELNNYTFTYTLDPKNLKTAFSDTFNLTVSQGENRLAVYVLVTNSYPVLKPIAPIAITNAPVARSLKIDDLATDPDADPLSFVTLPTATPAGCGTMAKVSDTEMSFTPAAGFVGACNVAFTATDGVTGNSQRPDGTLVPFVPAAGTQVFNITADPTAPTVTAITPASGPTLGGTAVTITGTGFTGATAVTIGGAAVTNRVVVSETQITATTPAGTAGTASVLVTTPLGTNAANTLYTYALSPQVVSFTSTAPTLPVVGATYTPTASGGAGTAPVVISVSGTCSIGANNLVTFNAAGVCLVNADQAADANYEAAPQVQQSITVGKAAQTVAFTSTAPALPVVGGTYTPAATGGASTAPVVLSATGTCSLASGLVTFTSAGTCLVNADQAGDANYESAPQVQQSITVGKVAQVVAFTSTIPTDPTVGGTYTPLATGGASASPVIIAASGACSLSNGAITFDSAGVCTITADQAGNENYDAAPQVQQSFSIGDKPPVATAPTVTTNPHSQSLQNGTIALFTAAATGVPAPDVQWQVSAGGGLFYSDVPGATDVNLSFTADISQDGYRYRAIFTNKSGSATTTEATLSVGTAPGVITTPSDQNVAAGATAQFQATASGSPAPSIQWQMSTDDGDKYTDIVGATSNPLSIITTLADDGKYYRAVFSNFAGVDVTKGAMLTVNVLPTVTSIAPNSGLPSGGTNVTITGTGFTNTSAVKFGALDAAAVTFTSATSLTATSPAGAAGMVDITVISADGSSSTSAADQFTYAKAMQSVAFTSDKPTATVGGTYTPAASATSGLTTDITVDASSATVCAITAGVVSFNAAGACVLNADQAGDADYEAASLAQQSITVGKAAQVVAFTSTAPTSPIVGGTYSPTASGGSSGLPVVFSATGTCSLASGVVTFNTAGTCLVNADQAGDANYLAAPQLQQSITVAPAAPSVTSVAPNVGSVDGGKVVTITGAGFAGATAVKFGAVAATSYTVNSDTSITATAPAGAAGAVHVKVTTAAGTSVTSASDTFTYVVNFSISLSISPVAKDSTTQIIVTGANGTVFFTSADPFCTVDFMSGVVTVRASTGSCQINVTTGGAGPNFPSQSSYILVPMTSGPSGQAPLITQNPSSVSANVGASATFTAAASGSPSPTVQWQLSTDGGANFADLPGETNATLAFAAVAAGQNGNQYRARFSNVRQSNVATSAAILSVNAPQISPTITSVTPSSGPTVGGTAVTITGNGFTGATGVAIGGASATGVTVVNDTTITATTPAGTAGPARVLVTSVGGSSNDNALFTYTKSAQVVAFTPAAPTSPVVGGTDTPTVTGGAGTSPVVLSASGSCSLSGGLVTFTSAGTCILNADQAGDANYEAATQVQQSITVGKASQTITFTPPTAQTFAPSGTIMLSARGGASTSPVIFTSISPSVCTVSSNSVTFVSAGTCTITASQAGDANYYAAPDVRRTFSIGQAANSITFTLPPTQVMTAGGVTLGATASSGLPVSYVSTSPTVCTVAGNVVTFVSAGLCDLLAHQPGDANYAAAADVLGSFTINKAGNVISFANPGTQLMPTGSTMLVASATSALPVTFIATTSHCTVAGNIVSFVSTGLCSITAHQAGDANYVPANGFTVVFVINPVDQVISFTPPVAQIFAPGGTVGLSATGGASGNPVTFASTDTAVCTTGGANGTTVTFVGAGLCPITASQAGDINYAAAPDVGGSFTINPANNVITFTPPSAQVMTTGSLTLGATASSGLSVSYVSTSPAVCTVAGNVVTFVSAGTCDLLAHQPGDANYAAATDVLGSFVISKVAQSVSFTTPAPVSPQVGGTYAVAVSATPSGLTVSLLIDAGSAAVCTLSGSTVSFTGAGTCKINASQPGDGTYLSANASQSFVVSLVPTTVSLQVAPTSVVLGQTVTLTATVFPATSTGAVAFNDGATVLCPAVTPVAGVATCTTTFTTAGTHDLSATFSGTAALASSTATPVAIQPVDQKVTDGKAIGGFISDRANMIVSNMFDMGRQIDRLNQAQQAGGGDSGSGQLADTGQSGKGDMPSIMQSSRLGGPSGATITAAGLGSKSGGTIAGDQDMMAFQSFLYDYLKAAGQSGNLAAFNVTGPMDMHANFAGGQSTASFKTSLSQVANWQQKHDKAEMNALGFGHNMASTVFMPLDIWAEGNFASYSGNRAGQFGVVTLGADYVLNPSLLVGLYSQFDMMNQTSGTTISGNGWMAGPYATARLSENVFWQARGGWGTSSNTINGTDKFGSTRWLVSSSLSGRWQSGSGLTFAPTASFTYFEDRSDVYLDSFGITIPGAKSTLGQLKLSPELSYGFTTDSGLWIEPNLSTELIWNFASTNIDGQGQLDGTATGPTGLRGKVKAGVNIKTPSGISISATTSYDGIGSQGFSSIAAQATLSVPLN